MFTFCWIYYVLGLFPLQILRVQDLIFLLKRMVDHRLLFLYFAILSINHLYWMSSLAITFEMRKVFHVFVVWYLKYYHIRIYSSQYQTQFLVSSRKASSVIKFIWCVFETWEKHLSQWTLPIHWTFVLCPQHLKYFLRCLELVENLRL